MLAFQNHFLFAASFNLLKTDRVSFQVFTGSLTIGPHVYKDSRKSSSGRPSNLPINLADVARRLTV